MSAYRVRNPPCVPSSVVYVPSQLAHTRFSESPNASTAMLQSTPVSAKAWRHLANTSEPSAYQFCHRLSSTRGSNADFVLHAPYPSSLFGTLAAIAMATAVARCVVSTIVDTA
eukprot:2121207-Pleurochrysis_carterae.AAC.1